MIEIGRESVCKIFGVENVEIIDFFVMIGEDFVIYMKEKFGLFMYIGVGDKEKNINYRLYSNKFNIDEKCFSIVFLLFL